MTASAMLYYGKTEGWFHCVLGFIQLVWFTWTVILKKNSVSKYTIQSGH